MEESCAGIQAYFNTVQALQTELIAKQTSQLALIAGLMAETIRQNRRIFIFGTGHSHMIAEEGHYRAGGLANVVPILSPAVMVHESAQLSSKLERTPGLAATLLERYSPLSDEILFVFSSSGVNALPIEMAISARERGLCVIGVTNSAYCGMAPLSCVGKRLSEVVDHLIDTGGPPGDSIVSVPGTPWMVGPASTILFSTILNCLVTETVFRLQASQNELPIYQSSNMPGAVEQNQKLLRIWSKRNPHL